MALSINGSSKESSTHDLLDAQAHVWNHMLNYVNSLSLRCAVQLGIPDLIHNHGKPMTLTEIAATLPIDTTKLDYMERLMRMLVHSEFFTKVSVTNGAEDTTQGYWLTDASRLLLKDNPVSLGPFVKLMLDPSMIEPWYHVSEWLSDSDPRRAYDRAHGMSFWELGEHVPRMNDVFNDGMDSDSRLINNILLRDCKHAFEGYSSLVDVGGGIGTTAKAIASAFPDMKCIVLELPHVIDGLEGTENLTYLKGDMFKDIPSVDVALLKWILHDWDDESSIEVLKKCKKAIGKGGKVVIIDVVLDEEGKDRRTVGNQMFFDLLMMVYLTGKERSEKQWSKLFYGAGFSGYKITPAALGVRSLIEVFP